MPRRAPFGLSINPDTNDPTRYTVWVSQTGLGMPNRDYYLKKGARFDAYRAAYSTYVTKVFELLGHKDPARSAKQVIGIENKIAAVAWPPERQRKVSEVNNPMDLAGLKKLVPNVDWKIVLAGVGLGAAQHFIVNETDAWIRARTEGFLEMAARSARRSALFNIPALEKGMRVDAHLAKALHCLQDSFSPGHVLRSEMSSGFATDTGAQVNGRRVLGTARRHASPACFDSAPPIRSIFDYNHPHNEADAEARRQHDESDYYAGSLAYAAANAAAYASADLMRIGLDSIANQQSDGTAWSQFVSRWLAQKLPHQACPTCGAYNGRQYAEALRTEHEA